MQWLPTSPSWLQTAVCRAFLHHPVDVWAVASLPCRPILPTCSERSSWRIHGRLLTAWSTAGIIGPVVVNYIREFQLAAGVPRDQLYNTTMYILCAMLIGGLICNYLIKPVDHKWHMSTEEVTRLQAASAKSEAACSTVHSASAEAGSTPRRRCSGPFVGIRSPGAYGKTLESAIKIF